MNKEDKRLVICKKGSIISKQLLNKLENQEQDWIVSYDPNGTIMRETQKISQWKVQKLWMKTIKKKGIIKALKDITFNNLVSLYLTNNKIKSIDTICRLQAPNLCSINLSHNNITNILALRKIQSGNITFLSIGKLSIDTIYIEDNTINQSTKFQQINSPQPQTIVIQSFAKDCQCQNVNFISKMRSRINKQLFYLCIQSPMRIGQQPVMTALITKFKPIGMRFYTRNGQF